MRVDKTRGELAEIRREIEERKHAREQNRRHRARAVKMTERALRIGIRSLFLLEWIRETGPISSKVLDELKKGLDHLQTRPTLLSQARTLGLEQDVTRLLLNGKVDEATQLVSSAQEDLNSQVGVRCPKAPTKETLPTESMADRSRELDALQERIEAANPASVNKGHLHELLRQAREVGKPREHRKLVYQIERALDT
jgi:hypothetical protein